MLLHDIIIITLFHYYNDVVNENVCLFEHKFMLFNVS